LIAYVGQGGLRGAHCDDQACSSATTSQITSTPNGAIAVAAEEGGGGLIAFSNSGDVKLARCADPACSHAAMGTVARGSAPSMVWRPTGPAGAGQAIVAYHDGGLKVCAAASCLDSQATLIDADAEAHPRGTSLSADPEGLVLISYWDGSGRLKVARCRPLGGEGCLLRGTPAILDASAGSGERYSSSAIGADGRGIIAYAYRDDQGFTWLKAAHCNNRDCTTATLTTLQGGGHSENVWAYPSLTIGADGLPFIAYYDGTSGALRIAHCADRACLLRDGGHP